MSKETLAEVAQFSKEAKLPLIIHVAETKQEQEDIQALQACSPIEYLHNLGLTGPNSLFVHCVHASDKDLEILKDTDTGFSYNPSSNMKLSSGIAPCTQAVRQGVRVGLGTDGAASNNNLNFLQEMNLGAKLQCLKYGSEHALNPQGNVFYVLPRRRFHLGFRKRNRKFRGREASRHHSYRCESAMVSTRL